MCQTKGTFHKRLFSHWKNYIIFLVIVKKIYLFLSIDHLLLGIFENLTKRTYGHYLKQVEKLRQKGLVSLEKIDVLYLSLFAMILFYPYLPLAASFYGA